MGLNPPATGTVMGKQMGEFMAERALHLSGRNLAIFSDYWGFDPEFNNFGNSNFNRFIDLAPFPPSRQFFFSVDVGF